MRRHLVLAVAATAALLIVSGCSSDSSTRRTVTAVVTVSSGAEVSGSAEAGPTDASGAPASGSADVSAASPSPSESPTSSSVVAAPIVSVDPLKVDCAAILSAADIKKIYGIDIPNDRQKITVAEVNADVGQTGRIRCLYGLNPEKTIGTFTVVLTQYTDAAAAQKQVDVTVQNETDNGAEIVPVTVSGYPATVAIRDGGLLIMAYDTWTMAIGASAGGDPAVLKVSLAPTAEAVLARVLKG